MMSSSHWTTNSLCTLILAAVVGVFVGLGAARPTSSTVAPAPNEPPRVLYKIVKAGGVDVLYRKAGPANAPSLLLLLHSSSASSHMFRNLIPALADRYQMFSAAGAELYKRDLKTLEFQLLDAGRFALENKRR